MSDQDMLTLHATSDESSQDLAADAWSSSNPAITTVDEDGIITGVAVGKVIITARLGGATNTAVVTVTAT
jgi:lactocepin